jgi:hypothetical protein
MSLVFLRPAAARTATTGAESVSARADVLHHVSDSLSLTSLETAGPLSVRRKAKQKGETDMKTTLCLEVEFDPEVTDAESLASAFDTLVDNALGQPRDPRGNCRLQGPRDRVPYGQGPTVRRRYHAAVEAASKPVAILGRLSSTRESPSPRTQQRACHALCRAFYPSFHASEVM